MTDTARPAGAAAGGSTPGTAELAWGGHRLVLLPGRAAWLPQRRMLLVADVHIGKALTFRRLGVPVPHGTTGDTLARLATLLERHSIGHLVFLGDLLHARTAQASSVQSALHAWRESHAGVEMTLVRGNHDLHAGDPPASLGVMLVDEPWLLPAPGAQATSGLALCHHPARLPGRQVLAGHLHPAIALGARARDRLRLPCFHFSDDVGVLPAFGSFTGMHPVQRSAGDQVYAIGDQAVHRV